MKRILIGTLAQIASGILLYLLGVDELIIGTISCSFNWLVCCYDAQFNFNTYNKKETDI